MGTVYLAERADGGFPHVGAVEVVPLAWPPWRSRTLPPRTPVWASLDSSQNRAPDRGGVSENGLPYLVMEFADGLAIDRYCDDNRLDTRAASPWRARSWMLWPMCMAAA